MSISEKQAAENQKMYGAAMADKVRVRVTGKYLKFDADNQEYVEGGLPVENNRHMKLRWPWQGHQYGPDDKGVIREITGRKPKQKKAEPTVFIYGDPLPRAAYEHYVNMMFKGENVTDRFEVELLDAPKEDEGEQDGGDDGENLDAMTKAELVAKGLELGLDEAELDTLKRPELLEKVKQAAKG